MLSETEVYTTRSEYDMAGNLVSKTDKEEKVTSHEYDDLARLVKTIDSMGKETIYTYDNRDNLIELMDAEGNTTRFEYDRNNRLVKESRPMGEETTYSYDVNGNLLEKRDPKNQKTSYIYNDGLRLETVNHFTGTNHETPIKTVGYAYDKAGRMTSYDDGTSSAGYIYDDSGRKISETVNYGSFTKAHAYSYYNNGTKKTFTGPESVAYGYLYDSNNNLTGVQIPDNGFVSWNSHTWNRPESVTLPGGTTRTYAYDPLMRIKSIEVKDPTQTAMMGYQYNYDKANNITAKQTEHGDYTYGYDDLYRLTSTDNPAVSDEAYTYDNVGNRLTAEGVTGEWGYSDNNELESKEDVSYTYDDNGNLVQKLASGVTTVYIYTVDNRLERMEDGSGSLIASYYYDPFGRRLWKETGGIRTYFHYSDEGLVAEFDQNGDLIKSYGYKPGSTWTTDPLFMEVGGEYYYYQNDHLGTPQRLTNVSGSVVWSAKYDSFGKANVEVQTVENNLRFPGQYFDDETGYHYNWNRYYVPSTGRYLTADPIGLAGGVNLYAYVGGNPVNAVDFMGLMDTTYNAKYKYYMSTGQYRAALDLAIGMGLGAAAINAAQDALQQQIEREANRREYHNRCDEQPPPGMTDPCELAKWKLQKAKDCQALRQGFSDRWYNGEMDQAHADHMTEIDQQIENARRAVRNSCCK